MYIQLTPDIAKSRNHLIEGLLRVSGQDSNIVIWADDSLIRCEGVSLYLYPKINLSVIQIWWLVGDLRLGGEILSSLDRVGLENERL